MKIHALVMPSEMDRIIYSIKHDNEWVLVRKGRKYLEFRKGAIKARIDKKRFENFKEDNMEWEITLTEIEEYMTSTYLYCKGKKEVIRKALEKLQKEGIKIKIWNGIPLSYFFS